MKFNFVLILAFLVVLITYHNCKRPVEFKNTSITAKVDSIIVYKGIKDPKDSFILINSVWYELPGNYYGSFVRYVEKGDSLYKESGRWDIYVYKKKNGTYIEKYFSGAQDYWK